jgi:hypothetical protein
MCFVISLIKDRYATDNDKWFEFNDAVVTQFQITSLGDVAFGGGSKNGNSAREKMHNAFILVYDLQQPSEKKDPQEMKTAVPENILCSIKVIKALHHQIIFINLNRLKI